MIYNSMANIHILTPCSRKNNLGMLKSNIKSCLNSKHKIYWHICFDTNFVIIQKYLELKKELKEDWIYLYSALTHFFSNPGKSQINFIITHFKSNLFNGYLYVLDDDNLLPSNFFEYDYQKEDSPIYLFPQKLNSGEIRKVSPFKCQIDQGQILIHSDIQEFYPLRKTGADGEFIEEICKKHPYKTIENVVVNYNKLA